MLKLITKKLNFTNTLFYLCDVYYDSRLVGGKPPNTKQLNINNYELRVNRILILL